ncbi:MAG TPA: hypothetical protein VEH84_18115, partial [Alphaproteobacteria bacterium]|nr:hypothetical protein [Alphaproteobacteria bacterium]
MNNRMIGAATALALLTGVSGFALAQSQPPATNADNQPPTMSGTTKPMTAQPTPDTTTTAQGGVQTG